MIRDPDAILAQNASMRSWVRNQQYQRLFQEHGTSRSKKFWNKIREIILKHVFTFRTIHCLVLMGIAFIGASIIAVVETQYSEAPFADAMFNSFSAVTCTGLTSDELSDWAPASIFVIFLLFELCSVCNFTAVIVPAARFFRTKKLVKERLKHFETYDDNAVDNIDDLDEFQYVEDPPAVAYPALQQTTSTVPRQANKTHQRTTSTVTKSTVTTTSTTTTTTSAESDPKKRRTVSTVKPSGGQMTQLKHDTECDEHSLKCIASSDMCSHEGGGNEDNASNCDDKETDAFFDEDDDDDDNDPFYFSREDHNTATAAANTTAQKTDDGKTEESKKNDSSMAYSQEPFDRMKVDVGGNMGLTYDYRMERDANLRLVFILICYSLGTQLLGAICLGIYGSVSEEFSTLASENKYNIWAWAFFTAGCGFCNVGFVYWQDGFRVACKSPFFVIVMSVLIIAGNTGIPMFVRFIVFMSRNLSPQRKIAKQYQSLRYILKNPGRISLHLFSSDITRVLILVYILVWFFTMILYVAAEDKWDDTMTWQNGWFVAVAARTSGLPVIDFDNQPTDFLALLMAIMLIGAYPAVILRGQSKAVARENQTIRPKSKIVIVYKYWRAVLLNSLTYLYISIIVISYLEIEDRKPMITFPSVLFEVMSAFGNVGFSFGVMRRSVSLSAMMTHLSKLIIMADMMIGRHRGLPTHVFPKDMRRDVKQEIDLGNTQFSGNSMASYGTMQM